MALKSLFKAIRKIPKGIEKTLAQNSAFGLRAALCGHPSLVVIGSGNSGYPARYFEWLVRSTSTIPCQFVTPLEYRLLRPRQKHICLLFSQGASRGDSLAIEKLCAQYDAPLFLVCSSGALEKETVASRLAASEGRANVFALETFKEGGFVSIVGAAAGFAAAYQIAAGLVNDSFPDSLEINMETVLLEMDQLPLPKYERYYVLSSPAGRTAADAFAGYHSESLGPVVSYDMKNFTHGIWRGLKEAGPHTVFLVVDKQVEELAKFLISKIGSDHQCINISAPTCHRTQEPIELSFRMLVYWTRLCLLKSEQSPAWSPLRINMAEWPDYRGINAGFDLVTMSVIPPPDAPKKNGVDAG